MDGWMGGWMDGWVDGWMDGWVGGWVGGWMDGWGCLEWLRTLTEPTFIWFEESRPETLSENHTHLPLWAKEERDHPSQNLQR